MKRKRREEERRGNMIWRDDGKIACSKDRAR